MKKFYHKFFKILNKIRRIERARRYEQLSSVIRKNQCKIIMEVGTWNGERALAMIKTAQKFHDPSEVEYYGFDIFELMDDEVFTKEVSKRPPPMDAVRTKLEETGAKTYLFRGFTEKTMPEVMPTLPTMDLVFIDGGHSMETITNDWNWTQHVMDRNTVVIFDDYWSGEWGKRKDAGCQSLVDNIDRSKFEVQILPIQDSFKKNWGVLKINFVLAKRRASA